jgi:hypothetical protein
LVAVKVGHEVSEVVKGFCKDIALGSRGEWSLRRYTSPTGTSKQPKDPTRYQGSRHVDDVQGSSIRISLNQAPEFFAKVFRTRWRFVA